MEDRKKEDKSLFRLTIGDRIEFKIKNPNKKEDGNGKEKA